MKKKKIKGETCERCGKEQAKKIMTIIDGACWQCGNTMKIAYISSDPPLMLREHSSFLPPSKFIDAEIKFAVTNEVNLQLHFSNTIQESYVANTCSNCGNFCGNHYLFQDYIVPAFDGNLKKQDFELGNICEGCTQ